MTETVRVQLKQTWFAPTSLARDVKGKGRNLSGRRFKKGEYVWPVSVKKYLPTSAKLLDEPAPFVDEFEAEAFDGYDEDDLSNYDHDRALAEDDAKANKDNDKITKTPEELLALRKANLRKGRETASANRAAAKVPPPPENLGPDRDADDAPAVTEEF